MATEGEIAYTNFADKTPHFVLSNTINVDWKASQTIREIEVVKQMKEKPGKDIYEVGGAKLISSLLNLNIIDELRLTIHPILLGNGKPLFTKITGRHPLKISSIEQLKDGGIGLVYYVK